jgi:hypothetical protein
LLISFFDDEEDTPEPETRTQRVLTGAGRSAGGRPQPRRAALAYGTDERTLRNRRLVAAGVVIVLIVAIVLLVKACANSEKEQSLKNYNHAVGTLVQEADSQVAQPLFTALAGASGKQALDVEVQVDQYRAQMQAIASHARTLSVPGEMTEAQRALLLALDLRSEGISKISTQLPRVLGSQNATAASNIAGAMETFLASDIIYSQRVVPLIQQTLQTNGIRELSTAGSRFLPNTGWLDPTTTLSRLSGQAQSSSATSNPAAHASSALVGVAVGTTSLAAEPTINHITGGGSPTFTVTLEDDSSNPGTNVKVDVIVTASGKQFKASHVINQTQPGQKVNVEIPVAGIPIGAAAKIEVNIEKLPGEEDLENNKATYLAVFSQ